MKLKLLSYHRYALLLTLSLFLLSNSLLAQGILFSPSNGRVDQLNSRQEATYQRMIQSQSYSDVQLIDIAPLDDVIGDHSIRLNLGDGDIHLETTTLEYVSESEYYLYAVKEATGFKNDIGRATLQLRSMDGLKFGVLTVGGEVYQIEDLTGGQNILMHEIQSTVEAGTDIDEPIVIAEEGVGPLPGSAPRTNCRVRVLFLYTTAATARTANLTTTAQAHIDQANQALINSSVSSSQLRFELAGAETLTTVNEAGQTAEDVLIDVRTDATAQNRRNANDADLVCLVADDNIGAFGTTLGIAYRGFNGAPAPNAFAYGMIQVTNSLGFNLFAHEGGHNMGCGHQNGNNNEPGFHKAHDWTWTTGWWLWRRTNRRQTIMWANANQAESVLNYSNPNVNHSSGNATGTATANNAQTLRDNSCTVAGYRSATDNLIVSINGPVEACPLETVCWSANVSGAPGPYTYQWSWTLNGTSYTNFGTGASACLNMFNFTAPDVITIRLTVTAPGQPARTAFLDLFLVDNGNGQIFCALKTANPNPDAELVGADNTMQIVPNPSDWRSEVRLHLTQDAPTKVGLYDMTGQKVMDIAQGAFSAGNHSFEIDVTSVPAGIYLIQAETNGQRLVQRFVVTH